MKNLNRIKVARGSLPHSRLTALAAVPRPAYADALLTGAVTSATGEKMSGVTVSAKAEKSTITTSVYTDESGNYYFPPLANGKYKIWAQALTFHRANGEVALNQKTARRNFVLQPMKDSAGMDSPVARR